MSNVVQLNPYAQRVFFIRYMLFHVENDCEGLYSHLGMRNM